MSRTIKRMTAILLSVILMTTIFTALPFTASAVTSGTTGDCTWTLDDEGTLTLSGNGAMEYRTWSDYKLAISKVVIEDGVTGIINNVFNDHTMLRSVTIGNSLTRIPDGAFQNCELLDDIDIPDSVTSIGTDAFKNTYWYNRQPEGPVYAGKVFLTYKGSPPFFFTLNNGTKGIADYAFWGREDLHGITIPDGVTNIGRYAFQNCLTLGDIELPDSVTEIGESAFSNCRSLKKINIPEGVTRIEEKTFDSCTGLKEIDIPDSVTEIAPGVFADTAWLKNQESGMIYAGKVAYLYKNNDSMPPDTAFTFAEGTNAIEAYAFADCPNLTSVTIPNSVTRIGRYAFRSTGLTDVTIPNSITSIEERAFAGCAGLTSVTILSSETFIKDKAFGYDRGGFEHIMDNFTVYGKKDSWAEMYATGNDFTFIPLNDEPTTAEPTTVEPTTEPAPAVMVGDVNNDGTVNGADAGVLSRYASGWAGYADKINNWAAADINNDGLVNGADAGILSRYASGWKQYAKYFA